MIAVAVLVVARIGVRQTGLRDVVIVDNVLQARDASGAVRWTHRFDHATAVVAPEGAWSVIHDLDGDGVPEVVVSTRQTRDGIVNEGSLACFSSDGALRWERTLADRLTFGSDTFGPPWTAGEVSIHRIGSRTIVAWITKHRTWWPSMLTTYDSAGRPAGTFVNSGWLAHVTESGDRLLVTGVSNSRDAPILAVLGPDEVTGTSPEDPRSPYRCGSCASAEPMRYFAFPRSEISRAKRFELRAPGLAKLEKGGVEIHVVENGDRSALEAIFELSDTLLIRRGVLGDRYWEEHRRLEIARVLGHPADRCPDRAGPIVQVWERDKGWSMLRAPATPTAGDIVHP